MGPTRRGLFLLFSSEVAVLSPLPEHYGVHRSRAYLRRRHLLDRDAERELLLRIFQIEVASFVGWV